MEKKPKVGRPPVAPDFLLYRLFEEKGIDKKSFAEACGITRQHLDRVLRGEQAPGKKLAVTLSTTLRLPLEKVLFLKAETEASQPKRKARA